MVNHKLTGLYMNSGKDIIDGLNRRHSSALKPFFVSFFPSLCVLAKKYVSETDIIEDIAQDSFLVYWESEKQFENLNALKGFLYKTVKNKCLNHLKLKGVRREILRNGFDKEEILHELVLEEETYRIIHNAVKELAPQSRRIIELSMKGYKNPEIAEELNVSINTIKTLKANAYQILREKLKGHVFIIFLINQLINS